MIRSRRRAHARLFSALVVILPVFFVVAIVGRPAPDYSDGSSHALASDGGFDARLVARPGTPGVLVLRPRAPVLRPDTLLYWSATRADGTTLPHDAVLIGHLAGDVAREIELPEAFRSTPGKVIIYSLGHQAVVDTIALASTPRVDEQGP